MRTLTRRLLTVPGVFLLLGLALVTLPVWGALALAIDLGSRGRRSALRCGAFLTWYLACEVVGLLAIAALTPVRLAGPAAFRRANRELQNLWGRALFLGARASFGIRIETRNAEVAARGPVLLMVRHATLVDTLIPTLAVSVPYGLDLRYVLKSELLWDPCLDIAGHRMGHVFARRGTADTARDVAAIAALAGGLGPRDGVLIYPEGTRFSSAKRARMLARLEQQAAAAPADDAARARLRSARSLRHVLPPRLGGALALLDAAPAADVVFCAHTGLEAANRFRDLWRGEVCGATLRASFWRVPRAEIPDDAQAPDARAHWLQGQWQRVDDWIDAARDAGS